MRDLASKWCTESNNGVARSDTLPCSLGADVCVPHVGAPLAYIRPINSLVPSLFPLLHALQRGIHLASTLLVQTVHSFFSISFVIILREAMYDFRQNFSRLTGV